MGDYHHRGALHRARRARRATGSAGHPGHHESPRSSGEMRCFDEPTRPARDHRTARGRDVGVMGIRAVQAGALTDHLDRDLPADHPTQVDYQRARPLRHLAGELGESAASLAHRYALSMVGVDTVVPGVNNRAELRDCLGAEQKSPLPGHIVRHARVLLAPERRRPIGAESEADGVRRGLSGRRARPRPGAVVRGWSRRRPGSGRGSCPSARPARAGRGAGRRSSASRRSDRVERGRG